MRWKLNLLKRRFQCRARAADRQFPHTRHAQFARRANLPHAFTLAASGKSPRCSRASRLDEEGRLSRSYSVLLGVCHGAPGARLQLTGQQPDGPEPSFAELTRALAGRRGIQTRSLSCCATDTGCRDAVLYRVNAQSEVYEQALDARGSRFSWWRAILPSGPRSGPRSAALRAVTTASMAASEGELGATVRKVLAGQGLTAQPPAGSAARSRWNRCTRSRRAG